MPRLATRLLRSCVAALVVAGTAACSDGGDSSAVSVTGVAASSPYALANRCVALSSDEGLHFLAATADGAAYTFDAADAVSASRFLFRASDLGKYLLYDEDQRYLVGEGGALLRRASLGRDIVQQGDEIVALDGFQSEGEWQLHPGTGTVFRLQHLKSGEYLTANGAVGPLEQAADLILVDQQGCAEFPELSVDASGEISVTEFEDGSVFGFVESHSHLLTNLAFGGGGVFHGAPFHPLGVEHALADCDLNHGEEGRRDFMGSTFSAGVGDFNDLIPAIVAGELPQKDHDTQGYPEFTDWPNAPASATHQVQYYKWLERAWLSGLRLLVQHATTNEVLCQLVVGIGAQPQRFDCNDMVSVDRIIDATYAMERYIDAQSGGPGQGWFRIVFSPSEARDVIRDGKLAIVLGIETSDLFNCFLVPFGEFSKCTEENVIASLDEYHARGVRVLFPVHKYDNAFSAGDGDRRVSDVGNFGHTGHYSNFELCADEFLGFPGGFDRGGVNFAALNQPRDEFDSPPPFDMSGFDANPISALFPHIPLLGGGSLKGEYCQKHGLTDLGEFLMLEMMKRGMIIEVDHFPRKSYKRAYELLLENDYPAMGTHGRNNNGLLYELGGLSKANFGRCRSADTPATMDDGFQSRIRLMREVGAFPAEGFGFDLNGFAGAPAPRFGDNSRCSDPQEDEGITYPFTSYAGDITLETPVIGDRVLDFNTEGMVHLGLVAELIEDVRRDGVTDQELEPLFKSAEAYLRVWEKSERRASELGR